MSRNLAAAAKAKKGRERFDKQPAALVEAPTPEPEPTPAPTPSVANGTAEQPRKRTAKPKAKRRATGIKTAKEKAKELAAAKYGVEPSEKLSRAEQMAIRRQIWVQLSSEITPEHDAKLDALAVVHGSRKAAIAYLIDGAEL